MATPQAAVAIVHTREREESVLLIRRAEREGDSWSGHWSFPGGRCDPGDRDPLDSALRELHEECGIRLSRECLEAALPHTIARRKAGPFLLVAPFVFRVDGQLATVLDPGEAAGAAWVPIRFLRDPTAHVLRPVPGRPREMLFPAVELSGAPLWGFTYRLITSWLGLDPDPGSGREAARAVLDFLLSQGLTLACEWYGRVAVVNGPIPVDRLLQHFSRPAHVVPGINCLEVQPDYVRIAGPAWEDWLIQSECEEGIPGGGGRVVCHEVAAGIPAEQQVTRRAQQAAAAASAAGRAGVRMAPCDLPGLIVDRGQKVTHRSDTQFFLAAQPHGSPRIGLRQVVHGIGIVFRHVEQSGVR
jgi:8-oxo-dGTP diphosphatase